MRRLLWPLTPLYRLALAAREMRLRRGWEPVRRLRFPVLSIGNLSTGGVGKTPLAIGLARALTARGFAVDVLSRGYGRDAGGAARVDPAGTPEEFGDEPLLIARDAGVPVFVARQRYQAGLLAESSPHLPSAAEPVAKTGAFKPLHILDDGFQHRQLHRHVDLLLLNREDWHDRLLPAGNLREPLRAARRADVICIPASDPELESRLRAWGWQRPIWRLTRRMDVPAVNEPVVAFCGIARPDQFFRGLQAAGLQVAARIAFPDHHRYTARDLERLGAAARSSATRLFVTTPKDQVRLPQVHSAAALESARFLTVGLRVEIEDQSAALDWLADRLTETVPPAHPL